MSELASTVGHGRSAWWIVGSVFGASLLVLFGLFLQSNTHLNHDLSWILYSSAQMLRGAEFGRDIIAANPPLAWFLTLPPVGLAELLSFDPVSTFRGFIAGTLALPLLFTWWYLRGESGRGAEGKLVLLSLAAGYVLFLGCYRDFGQREHLAFAYALPYLLLAAGRLQSRRFPVGLALLVGLAAGVGLALKPYFLAVPLFVEVLALARTRSLRFSFRPEVLALAGFVSLYLVSILHFTPGYVFEVVPTVRPIYWGFNNDLTGLLQKIRFDIIGFLVAAFLALSMKQEERVLHSVLIAAAGGFLLAYILQMKGYTYHSLPFRSLVLMALAAYLGQTLVGSREPDRLKRRAPVALAGIAFVVVIGPNILSVSQWYELANRDHGAKAAQIDEVIGVVERHAAGDGFLALSTHPFPGFPTAVYVSAEWTSRTNSALFVPAVAKLRSKGALADAEVLRFAEEKARDFLLHDLAADPRLVLVDARPSRHAIRGLDFDILSFYLEEPRIREIWSHYRELDQVGGFRVFLRREEGGAE